MEKDINNSNTKAYSQLLLLFVRFSPSLCASQFIFLPSVPSVVPASCTPRFQGRFQGRFHSPFYLAFFPLSEGRIPERSICARRASLPIVHFPWTFASAVSNLYCSFFSPWPFYSAPLITRFVAFKISHAHHLLACRAWIDRARRVRVHDGQLCERDTVDLGEDPVDEYKDVLCLRQVREQ